MSKGSSSSSSFFFKVRISLLKFEAMGQKEKTLETTRPAAAVHCFLGASLVKTFIP